MGLRLWTLMTGLELAELTSEHTVFVLNKDYQMLLFIMVLTTFEFDN